MTGAHFRVERDGKWEAIEIEHLTNDERARMFEGISPKETLNWINLLCKAVARLEEVVEEA